jgi:diadenosine tetraphosphate (Ap4A) HIT family hydrolase
MSMIESPAQACPLCSIGNAPALWRNDKLSVIVVDDPDYPGYMRVVWHVHAAEMTDLIDEDRLRIMAVVLEVEATQRDHLGPDKVNLAQFGNMVPHLHWHVIPRWRGDRHFPDAIWAAPRVAVGSESAEFRLRHAEIESRLPEYHRRLQERLTARFA